MARLPQPGGDNGNWGTILNEFLSQAHKPDGLLKDNSVTSNTIAPGAVTKTTVGLSNVDNTSDANKPVSTAQQTALDLKADTSALATKLNTADLDTQTASKITTNGSATQTALNAAYAPHTPTKRVTMNLGSPNSFAAQSGAVTAWSERIPLLLPVKTKRWRVKVANKHIRADGNATVLTTPFTLSDFYMGQPGAAASSGRLSGAYSSAPVKVLDGGNVPTDGTDWVSAWVTDPTMQLSPSQINILGHTISAPASGSGAAVCTAHHGFRNSAAGANATLTVASKVNYYGQTTALDQRVEYEFEGDEPIGLYVGASGEEGYNLVANSVDGGYEIVALHETYPGVHGMRNRIPWVNAGISGGIGAAFNSPTNGAFSRFDLATTVPDFAVVSMGGNSILTGGITTLAGLQTETATVLSSIRALGIKRIFLCTVIPIGEANNATAKEILRNAYNTWIRTNPLDAHGVIDVDLIVRDPTNNLIQLPGFVDTDKIHPTLAGYQRWGSQVGVR